MLLDEEACLGLCERLALESSTCDAANLHEPLVRPICQRRSLVRSATCASIAPISQPSPRVCFLCLVSGPQVSNHLSQVPCSL